MYLRTVIFSCSKETVVVYSLIIIGTKNSNRQHLLEIVKRRSKVSCCFLSYLGQFFEGKKAISKTVSHETFVEGFSS